jgi:hypothetical protein
MVFRCILIVSLVLSTQLTANSQITIHRSYALFVQSFAKYSSWPNFTGDFKVLVLGETPAFDELQKSMEGKSFAGAIARVVKVNEVTSVADACVIYLADEKSDLLAELVKATDGKPILIITERQLLHQGGAGISFTMVDNRLRYDMNGKDLQKRNLKTAMQIVTLAHEVL